MLTIPSDPAILRVKTATLNFAQTAATYDAFTATGDVWVEVEQAFMKTVAGGLTSATIQTNHTAGAKSIVASTLVAALTADTILSVVTNKFVLPDTKKIQYTIVSNGNAGVGYLTIKWAPITAGATLS